MVRAGAAVAYGAYEREEAEARDARRGVWSSRFDRPQDWRAAHPHPHARPQAERGSSAPASATPAPAPPLPPARPAP
ncbi:MAG: hypothetical protein HZY79_14655 [Rhodoblastus sp.]|nr:MAG: hypothetical protein HZY79_14655 [Rhodoblastus sp.]